MTVNEESPLNDIEKSYSYFEEEDYSCWRRFCIWIYRVFECIPLIGLLCCITQLFRKKRHAAERAFVSCSLGIIPILNCWRFIVLSIRCFDYKSHNHLRKLLGKKPCDKTLDNWMQMESIKTKSIFEITIPGSHDSGTYTFASNLILDSIKIWSKCQSLCFYNQLKIGTRFFDIRIIDINDIDTSHTGMKLLLKKNKNLTESNIWIAHTAICIPIQVFFRDIKNFLSMYPKEIIIISIRGDHPYNIRGKDIEQIYKILMTFFDEKQFINQDIIYNKIEYFQQLNKNLIILMDNLEHTSGFEKLFVSRYQMQSSSWGVTCSKSSKKLESKIRKWLQKENDLISQKNINFISNKSLLDTSNNIENIQNDNIQEIKRVEESIECLSPTSLKNCFKILEAVITIDKKSVIDSYLNVKVRGDDEFLSVYETAKSSHKILFYGLTKYWKNLFINIILYDNVRLDLNWVIVAKNFLNNNDFINEINAINKNFENFDTSFEKLSFFKRYFFINNKFWWEKDKLCENCEEF